MKTQQTKSITLQNNSKLVAFMLIGVAFFLFAPEIYAQETTKGIGGLSKRLTEQLPGFADVLAIIVYVAAVFLGLKGILKLKESNESNGQVKMGTAVTYLVCSVLCFALPSLLQMGGETIFGTYTETSSEGWGADR